MIEAYGETVWDLSHNVQVRIGDPIRTLDWEQIELQRPGAGLSDRQIAEKIGLTHDQMAWKNHGMPTKYTRANESG